jgi:hypothetical protein
MLVVVYKVSGQSMWYILLSLQDGTEKLFRNARKGHSIHKHCITTENREDPSTSRLKPESSQTIVSIYWGFLPIWTKVLIWGYPEEATERERFAKIEIEKVALN